MVRATVPQTADEDFAAAFIKCGMRLSTVQALTGISPRRLRVLYKSIHGRSSSPARTPGHSHASIRSFGQSLEVSEFIKYYDSTACRQGYDSGSWRSLNPKVLLDSYSFYVRMTKFPININLAFEIIRDICGGRLSIRTCASCGSLYPFALESQALNKCPMC